MVNSIIADSVTPPRVELQVAEARRTEQRGNAESVSPTATTTRIDEKQILEAVSALEQGAQSLRRSLAFTVHEATGRTVVTVSDKETGEVIRQIPPEETLDIAARIREVTAGLFLTEEA